MQKFQDVVLDSQGRPVAGAVIAVQEYPSGDAATVYQTDVVGTAYEPTTDDYGAFYFYAANGNYSYTVTVAGVLRKTVNNIQLFDSVAEFSTSGTWTPTDVSGGTATLSSAGGEYYKLGDMVFISGLFRFASNGDTTAAALGGLPFPAKTGSYAYNIQCSSQGNTFGGTISGTSVGGLVFSIAGGASTLVPRWADLPGAVCSNGQLDVTTVYFAGWYRTD